MLLNSWGKSDMLFDKETVEMTDVFHDEVHELAADLSFFHERDMEDYHVIYILGREEGSTCSHIPTLAKLFPKTIFYIYRAKSTKLAHCKNIILSGEIFDDEEANKWESRLIACPPERLVLISKDKDLQQQKNWLNIIKPAWWSISFSIPEDSKTLECYHGLLTIIPFGKADSQDLRLHGTRSSLYDVLSTYVIKDIICALFHHNTVIRADKKMFANLFTGTRTEYSDPVLFDNGFDSTYLLCLVMSYSQRAHAVAHPRTESQVIAFTKRLLNFMM